MSETSVFHRFQIWLTNLVFRREIVSVQVGGPDSDTNAVASHVDIDCASSTLCLSGGQMRVKDIEKVLEAYKNKGQLKHVILEGLEIYNLPAGIGSFTNLRTLSLQNNYLEVLPWSLIYLKQLKKLDVSFNELSSLPHTIGYLPSLESFAATNNNISTIPNEVLNLSRLRSLHLADNPLVSPPCEVVSEGVKAVFEYLRKRQERRDLFEGYNKEYDTFAFTTKIPSLLHISIKCILRCNIDFLSAAYVPPRIRAALSDEETVMKNSICICKCSKCNKYFSKKAYFEIHDCNGNVFKRKIQPNTSRTT
ncbi:leucine-rich repeat protein soc-2 [Nematostella vectensis]|uniref:leucine-rich repeat protein soc-2 n=1 Tax=Nematostella vectensis TaxID=45351 RepID=UPI00138FD7F8|nr:leucine-rich repeat protein soc-2 [Nematostella vectensis]